MVQRRGQKHWEEERILFVVVAVAGNVKWIE